jgi:hypothetical protein
VNTYEETFYFNQHGIVINKGEWDTQDGANPIPEDAIRKVFSLPYPSLDGVAPTTPQAEDLLGKLLPFFEAMPLEVQLQFAVVSAAIEMAARRGNTALAIGLLQAIEVPDELAETKQKMLTAIGVEKG